MSSLALALSTFIQGESQPVANPGFPRGGVRGLGLSPTYDFAKISPKLHEIERIWTPRGGAYPKFYI